jgi:hypothetical protein
MAKAKTKSKAAGSKKGLRKTIAQMIDKALRRQKPKVAKAAQGTKAPKAPKGSKASKASTD